MKKIYRWGMGIAAVLVLAFALTACDEDNTLAVPQGFCGFVQGKGGRDKDNNANGAAVSDILYQGQSVNYRNDRNNGYFFPCVTRNYVISPENISGDTHQSLQARTSDGTPVGLWVTLYWQPNQSEEPIKAFIGFCQGKYGCAATSVDKFNGTENNQNASTPGWNKMLAENVFPVLQRISEAATRTVDDNVWRNNDPIQREQIAAAMSSAFAAEFQKVTGTTQDLLCGSGSTGSGKTFDCKQVYIVVDGVFATQGNMQGDNAAAKEAEAKRKLDQEQLQADLDLTNAKYGPLAPSYRACRDLGNACKFVVGPGGNIQVQTG